MPTSDSDYHLGSSTLCNRAYQRVCLCPIIKEADLYEIRIEEVADSKLFLRYSPIQDYSMHASCRAIMKREERSVHKE